MSDNLCYRDAYARQVDATVVEVGGEEVLLDRTAFYRAVAGSPRTLGS